MWCSALISDLQHGFEDFCGQVECRFCCCCGIASYFLNLPMLQTVMSSALCDSVSVTGLGISCLCITLRMGSLSKRTEELFIISFFLFLLSTSLAMMEEMMGVVGLDWIGFSNQ